MKWVLFLATVLLTAFSLRHAGLEPDAAKFRVIMSLTISGATFYFLHEEMAFIGLLQAPMAGLNQNTTPGAVWRFLGFLLGLISVGCFVFW